MHRTKLILAVVSLSCLWLSDSVPSREPDADAEAAQRDAPPELVEAEFEVRTRELELLMSEHAVGEAKVEVQKVEVQVRMTEKQGGPDQVALAKLELKQRQIGLEMRELQTEFARLNLERARTQLRSLKSNVAKQPQERARVHLEYDDDLDVVIIRGTREGVDKIRALIERADKQRGE